MIDKYRFNGNLARELNVTSRIFLETINWMRESRELERVGPKELASWTYHYALNYKKAKATIEIFDGINPEPFWRSVTKLPCHQGGKEAILSVMWLVKKQSEENPKNAKIQAAAEVVQTLEALCHSYLVNLAGRIYIREYGNELCNDRYTECYIDDDKM